MIRPSAIATLDDVERELDLALRTLRGLDGDSNLIAKASTEYRIGALRRRRAVLQERHGPEPPQEAP